MLQLHNMHRENNLHQLQSLLTIIITAVCKFVFIYFEIFYYQLPTHLNTSFWETENTIQKLSSSMRMHRLIEKSGIH